MDTRKILVADASLEFCGALSDALGGAYELRICHDGLQTQSLLETFQPDVLVLDLTLPQLDGIAVLKMAVSAFHRPSILVTDKRFSTIRISHWASFCISPRSFSCPSRGISSKVAQSRSLDA